MSSQRRKTHRRAVSRPALCLGANAVLQELESRLLFNLAPFAPVITEPTTDGKLVDGADVHMEIGDFADPDPLDVRQNTDWEIWTTGATPQRVWFALAKIGPFDDHHIHLGDGTFDGPLAGRTTLDGNTDYELRVRQRDSSGDPLTDTSPWATRTFHTLTTELPTAAGWVSRQSGYKVEELPLTFPAGELNFRLPIGIVFVPEPIHSHHPDAPFFYVMELYGSIRVVTNNYTVRTYATGLLNYNPNGPISGSGENGSAGLTIDPSNGDLYATMLYDDLTDSTTDTYPKIVRYTSTDGGITGVGTDILKMPLEPMRQSHFISNITFGPSTGPNPDPNHLYVHIGDGFVSSTAQNLQLFRGKIIRLNRDGSAPTDNPFYNPVDRGADGRPDAEDYVWASGYRNPFGGAWRDTDGQHYVVENGPSRDRFSQMVRARNYLYDGTDASMNNYNIAYSPTGSFEGGVDDWNPAPAPVNIAFIQQSTGGFSQFPIDKWDHAFVALSGATHAAGPNASKSIQEWVLNPDGTRQVAATGTNPRELVSYEGSGYSTAAGLAAGPDGLYFTTLYPEFDPNPVAVGAKILRVVYTGNIDPVNHYRFEEATGSAVTDSGLQPNNGSLVNSPSRIVGIAGTGAIQLDGVNDYVSMTQNAAPRLGGTATLVAWIRTTQVGNVKMYKAPGIAGVEEAFGDNDIFWGWLDDAGRIGLMAGDTPGAKSINPVNDGVWHQVAFTRDADTGVVKVYVDGGLQATATSAPGAKTTAFTSLGRIEDTAGAASVNYFAGALDDVRVYDRILSDQEIAALFPSTPNAAPTVATDAAAIAPPDNPALLNLSVLGADDSGEANLTYTWSILSKPTGVADPVFFSNGSNGSKNTLATLAGAGAYQFRVTIRDSRGLFVTSEVSVMVLPVFSSITVSPSSVTLSNGASQLFTAVARDQFAAPLAVQPNFDWSVENDSVGAISALGLYVAPATGTGNAKVIASAAPWTGQASVAINPSDVTAGLVTNWRLDNNGGVVATDSAGSNNGTLTNGPVWSVGKVGPSAITFDGTNDHVATTNLATLLGSTATLTGWIKTTQVGNVKMYRSPGIAGVDASTNNDIFWGWIDNTGRIGLKVGDNNSVAKSISPINDGQWHHVAMTRDVVTGQIKLYVDGALNATATADIGAKTTPFGSFGRIEDVGGTIDYFKGSLDELRIYDRVLTASEVSTVMSAGVAPPSAVTYLSDLPYQVISNGYGPAEKDRSNGELPGGDGRTITLNGVTYPKGLGVHANSEIIIDLNGQYTSFVSDVGIDDESGSAGSVIFQVFLDDIKVFDSGVMTGTSATRSVNIDVTGRNKLQLIVTDAGDGADDDHADWAGARLTA